MRELTMGGQPSDGPTGQAAHRLVVLQRLALELHPGQRFDETHLNGVLSLWHPDYAQLRQALSAEGFRDRQAGRYWRSGGRVQV